ncbi:MAG TPA: hypothetical protein VNX26_06720 [Candidatus Acidoferrum sp.]|jgi:hypothetical protein|nr:hypothetical protein [Candidatus Acidoferrum sp.]
MKGSRTVKQRGGDGRREANRKAKPPGALVMIAVKVRGVRKIIVFAFLVWSGMASATTYYVSSSTGNDANSGTSSGAAWQTVAKVNGQTFLPGDSILFKRGDVWNESLATASSGSSGNPITFDAYGSGAAPNLTGYYAVPALAWVLVTGNAWKAAVPAGYTTINFCLFGSIWGQKVTAVSSNLTAKWDFYLANGFLYVYSQGNPATYYNEPIVPMALSNVPVINVNGKSWLTFQHFLVNWFDQYGVYVQGTSDHLVFANMEADSMIPQGTQPLGFYVNESAPGPGDIKIYNAEAHLNYDGFRFDGAATAITMVNDKGYANRDGALVDNTGAVTYSYCHFYASSLAVAVSTDVEWTSGSGPTAGAGNVAADTAPAVQMYQRYPAEVTLTVDDAGMTAGADTYYGSTVLPLADAASVPVGVAITVGYPLAQTLVSEFQGWVNAGRDVTSHSLSHTYYTNTDALEIQYTGSGTAATLNISNKTLMITVTGASDSVSYNLAQGQPQGTIQGLRQALAGTGKFTATETTPCQGPYGTGCSAYTEAALLAQDLADVSGQNVKTSVYHMQLDVTRLTTDEIALSRQWMTTNLTGLPATPVYIYPGGYETTTMQGITAGVPYTGARGALKEDLGVNDTYADGFNLQNITSFGVNPSWQGLTAAALNQKVLALAWKESAWGVPWGIFWHLNELSSTEITNLIQDFKNSGATIQTNTGLVNWLHGGTQENGTDGSYYYKVPATSMTLDFRATKNSPVVDAGQNLGAAYAFDINGVNQNSYGSGWEIGAHVYQGYATYGENQPGSYFRVGVGAGAAGCGPPLYNCSSTSNAVVQTPAPPAVFAGGSGYNQIGYDTSINPSGIDPILRASDSSMLGGHSPSSTYSGGDNDAGWSCTGRTDTTVACSSAALYLLAAAYGGCPVVEGIEIISGLPNVVAPFPASASPPFAPCAALAFSQQDPTIAYMEGSNAGDPTIYQIAYTWDGTAGHSPTPTKTTLYDIGASCSVLPNGTAFNQHYASPVSVDVHSNIFFVALSNVTGVNSGIGTINVSNGSNVFTVSGFSLQTDGSLVNAIVKVGSPAVSYTIATITSTTTGTLTTIYGGTTNSAAPVTIPSGQGTGIYLVAVQLSPAACAVYNVYKGIGNGTGAWAGSWSIDTGCNSEYVHDGFMMADGQYAQWSNSGGGGISCGNTGNFWNVGTSHGVSCTGTPSGGVTGTLCEGHEAIGYHNEITISNPNFYDFDPANASSSVPFVSFGAIPPSGFSGDNCEDHFSWRNATSAGTQPIIGSTANNNYSASGTTSSWIAPGANENYALTQSGTLIRFGHNYILGPGNSVGCGTSNVGPFDAYFTAQNGIGTLSQDGRLWVFNSSMLGQLGTDIDGNIRADDFVIELQ